MATAGEGANSQALYVPELLRIKGEVVPRKTADQSAQDCFNHAGEMAREHDALFWELRIALSRARPRLAQRRNAEAKQILAPEYERFAGGYETTGLRAARIMLDALPAG